jgi:DNA-directed RNA polymerase subunit RPC12/RpoP
MNERISTEEDSPMGNHCSQCGSVVWWEGELRVGDRLACPNCFVSLLVVRLEPICLKVEAPPQPTTNTDENPTTKTAA